MKYLFSFIVVCLFSSMTIHGQWSNRYPKVDGFGHHVYLEGYELPILNAGPTDPAPSPIDKRIVFAAKGWLWLMDTNVREASRITSSAHVDSKPNWSPNGDQIVFIRDNSSDTEIVLLDLASMEETVLVNTKALDLDPIFSRDGAFVYYASADVGSIDIWRINLSTNEKQVITKEDNLERLPVPTNSSKWLVYLKKEGFSYDSIELLNTESNESSPLAEENFTSQAAFSLSPDNQTLVYSWPQDDFYELRLLDVLTPKSTLLLTKSNNLPLSPKFSANGKWVYYFEFNMSERSELKRISINGGEPEVLDVLNWEWNIPTSKLKITSKVDGALDAVRMSITDQAGHPIVPETGIVHSDGQNGIVFFYSPGGIEVEVPQGDIKITAVHGFSTIKTTKNITVNTPERTTEISLSSIWNADENGWYSGDNHFHINYGGTSQLDPDDIVLDLRAEDLDVAFPLLANLGQRFLQQNLWKWKRDEVPLIEFGQEVRSHFLGHLGLLGTKDLFWPWVWGPYYDIYGRDDRTNAEALRFAKKQNALGGYVHPTSVQDPFTEKGARRIPIELIADAVLGESDYIELGCLWSDEIGTAALWHAILNIGEPLAISAGSDVMNDLYRTMAIGATRVYVKPEKNLTMDNYLEALKNGRSFVSNGPLVEFEVEDKISGGVISTKNKKAKWTLNVHSATPYNKVELFINGEVVWTKKGNTKPGSKSYKGTIVVPDGGWVTARVSGGSIDWPLMDSYPFAECAPIWFNEVGSIDITVAKQSAEKLLMLLEVSKDRLEKGYGESAIPKLKAHFEKAKQKLLKISN
ncbi:CehA/McbA family metallohydrolase [uncultured Algibacter sp.]|uniref:CehA/McbA family metallohydrolase n=1 Tax=uncultured Algibacter sp. TaxID=298659 RepID=UPI002629CB6D|nr:CehA/McbA family metallohydrolase [uncultured Algibacter sp.]